MKGFYYYLEKAYTKFLKFLRKTYAAKETTVVYTEKRVVDHADRHALIKKQNSYKKQHQHHKQHR